MFIARRHTKHITLRRSEMYCAPTELRIKELMSGYKHFVPNGTKLRIIHEICFLV